LKLHRQDVGAAQVAQVPRVDFGLKKTKDTQAHAAQGSASVCPTRIMRMNTHSALVGLEVTDGRWMDELPRPRRSRICISYLIPCFKPPTHHVRSS
jgi:hypothetical protein